AVLESWAACSEGRPAEGLAIVEKALERYHGRPWLLAARAGCLLNLGRFKEAGEDLDSVLGRGGKFPLAVFYRAAVEMLSGDTKRAMELARNIVARTPRFHGGWHLLGQAAFQAGELEEAREAFKRAGWLKEIDGPALAGRALVCL